VKVRERSRSLKNAIEIGQRLLTTRKKKKKGEVCFVRTCCKGEKGRTHQNTLKNKVKKGKTRQGFCSDKNKEAESERRPD